ncbi:MAG: hypothetical protein COB20_12410 [SAR86 cluster bacterium]|uniref:Uncharacterized protein n=1 Tax=SAR86 cluster bacterium TaxID=2030880 RepID=A0A2A4X0P8_9GAMM|nr:MAG: hypothetical protein COB20_12410 [SAR86 cluster bacterium]
MARYEITAIHSNIKIGRIPTCFFLLLLLGPIDNLAAQDILVPLSPIREYLEQEQRTNYDDLLVEFGNNKKLPKSFQLQALLALRHYPELRDTKINFIVSDVSIPLSSRPHWSSMLRSAKNRTYQVIIDSELEGPREALLLKNQPFNAQIGIIGHELAHTVYYLNRSFFGIIGDALCQLTDCRIKFERATDRRLIDYGLGWQRFDHATFVRSRISQDRASAFTAEGGDGAYMSPAEIMQIMEGHEAYSE